MANWEMGDGMEARHELNWATPSTIANKTHSRRASFFDTFLRASQQLRNAAPASSSSSSAEVAVAVAVAVLLAKGYRCSADDRPRARDDPIKCEKT